MKVCKRAGKTGQMERQGWRDSDGLTRGLERLDRGEATLNRATPFRRSKTQLPGTSLRWLKLSASQESRVTRPLFPCEKGPRALDLSTSMAHKGINKGGAKYAAKPVVDVHLLQCFSKVTHLLFVFSYFQFYFAWSFVCIFLYV